jgi:hypothetical protein
MQGKEGEGGGPSYGMTVYFCSKLGCYKLAKDGESFSTILVCVVYYSHLFVRGN